MAVVAFIHAWLGLHTSKNLQNMSDLADLPLDSGRVATDTHYIKCIGA